MNWNEYFVNIAATLAMKSCDPNTKVGCVVAGVDNEIRSTGYNDLPRGMKHFPERRQRPLKYKMIAHAEMNAVCHAARIGISLKGCRLYIAVLRQDTADRIVSMPPCPSCAIAIIQSGIKEILLPNIVISEYYREDFKLSYQMLNEAGVKITEMISDVIATPIKITWEDIA